MVARLFGDEFAILLEAPTGIEDTRRTAERIQECLRAPFTFDEQEVFVGCSIGIVAGLGKDPGDDAIVSGTIDLAHALGLKVVAEGVETAEQLARLEELGCDLAQGFFLSEPLSVEEASDLLANGHHR